MPETISVRPVESRKDLNAFLSLPFGLYRSDPLWAPPIRLLERLEFRRNSNPVLSRSPHALMIAEGPGGIVRGRVIAYADPRYNRHYGVTTAFFGSFEAEDAEAAAALFEAVGGWSSGHGLTEILGPIDPVAECWGFAVDGFGKPPVFMSPYNPPSYPQWAEAAGFEKAKDLIVYEIDTRREYEIPARFERFERRFREDHPAIETRRIDMRDFDRDVGNIVDVLNDGVAGNWGYVPVEDDESRSLAAKLRPIADPDAVWFVEDAGRPVACALGFPDLNVALRKSRGRLLPFGWYRLLSAKRTLRDYRLWGLAVRPGYQGMGLDVLIYMNLYRALRKRGVRLEANYVLEDNVRIINALVKLGMKPIKRYRIYAKPIG